MATKIKDPKVNPNVSEPSSANLALAQQAVNKGYVGSTQEYLDAEARGRALAGNTTIPTIAVDKLGTSNKTPTLPNPPSTNTRVSNGIAATPTTVTTPAPTTPEAPKTLRQQLEERLSGMIGGSQIDTEGLREELRVAEKAKLATDLENKMLQSKQNYDNQILELEKNKEGKLTSALNAEINRFSQDANRDLAQQSISYKIANDDYVGAEKIYNDRVNDLKEQRQYEMQVFQVAYDFVQNDLTESEKIQVQQAFQEKQDLKNFEQQKELANYQSQLSRGDYAYKAALDQQSLLNSSGLQSLTLEENAKLNSTPQAKAINDASKYADAVKTYKEAINKYGTGQLFGEGKGALNQAYSQLVAATKDYYTLGTYDNGVEKLVGLGIPQPSIFGVKSGRIAALDTALTGALSTLKSNAEQLSKTGFANSVEGQGLISKYNDLQDTVSLQTADNTSFLNLIPSATSTSNLPNTDFFNLLNFKK